jgi:hypothetical protein
MPSSRPSDKKNPTSHPSSADIFTTKTPSNAPVKAIGGSNSEGLSAGAWAGIAAGIVAAIGGIGLWWRNRTQRQAENRIVHPPVINTQQDNPEIIIDQVVDGSMQSAMEEGGINTANPLETRLATIVIETRLLGNGEHEVLGSEKSSKSSSDSSEAEFVDQISEAEFVDQIAVTTVERGAPKSVTNPRRNILGPTIYNLPESFRSPPGGSTVLLEPLLVQGGGGRGSEVRSRDTSPEKIGKTIPDGKGGHK